ncbi:MAG TPA: hypothetical protein VGD39_15515, partial [Nocardioides sp.]
RRDAQRLRDLAARIRAGEIPNHHASLFDSAARSAASGEPLIVRCTDPVEALQMAEGFVPYGVERPAVEALGTRTH